MNKKKISKLTEEWQDRGIITAEQGEQMIDSAPVAADVLQKRLPTIFAILGIVLFAAGIFKLISNNWEALGQLTKLGIMLIGISVSYYSGYELKFRRKNYPRIGEALILLGALLFGATLALISQMYHFSDNFRNGVLVWTIASLLLAYAIRSKPVLLLGLVSFIVWYSMGGERAVMSIVYLGIAFYFIGSLQHVFQYTKDFKKTFQVAGLAITLITNFYFVGTGFLGPEKAGFIWTVSTTIALVALLSAFTQDVFQKRPRVQYLEYFAFAAVFIYHLFLGLSMFSEAVEFGRLSTGLFLFNNTYMLIVTVFFIFTGYVLRQRYMVNFSIVMLLLHVIYVYFTSFGQYMSSVGFFLVGGVLFFGIAFAIEILRRKINKRIKDV